MKSTLLLLLLSLAGSFVCAQERIDSLYYDRNGIATGNRLFADYLRIARYPADTLARREFRDFYPTGELRREGYFRTIDSLDDARSRFDGENTTYYRNGHVHERLHYANGLLDGEYLLYDEEGGLREERFYVAGAETGLRRTHLDDGICRIEEYNAGQPLHDYYLLADSQGNTLKFSRADNSQIMESPQITERAVSYHDGRPWQFYFKNGITVALSNSVVRDYGKWHRIELSITNNSLTPIDFIPERDITSFSMDDNAAPDSIRTLKVWSCDEYLKKVNRHQTWAAVLVGLSEGLATAGAGYSTSYTTATAPTADSPPIRQEATAPLQPRWLRWLRPSAWQTSGWRWSRSRTSNAWAISSETPFNPARPSPDSSMLTGNGERASISSSTSKGLNTSMNGASTGKAPSPDNRHHHRYNSPTAGPFRPGGKVVANPTDIGSAGRVCACPEEKNGQQFG